MTAKALLFIIFISTIMFCFYGYSQNKATRTIYVSQATGIDEDNGGTDSTKPLRTIYRAVELAKSISVDTFKILLRGGEVFDQFTSYSNSTMTNYDKDRNQYAMIWDINRHLILSTYGSNEKAVWYSGKYTYEGGPQTAIVVNGTSATVVIQNMHFKRWQCSAIMVYKANNVSIINNTVEEIGSLYFPDEKSTMSDGSPLYAAGAIYPKNSSNILIKGNYLKNLHNEWGTLSQLHAFYMTRLANSEVSNNVIVNASGPPLKVRRSGANNIYIHDNEFYYTSSSKQINATQQGFLRYSGDADEGCPYNITIEKNKFYYPFVWEDKENAQTAVALKYSISNTTVCGSNACEDTSKVKWINNDFRFNWESGQQPTPIENSGDKIVPSFKLFQNYPNPCHAGRQAFNPSTNFCYQLSEAGWTSLKIYDLLGRHIVTLQSGYKQPGYYSVTWNAKGNRSGIYFYQLIHGKNTITKKMLLLK
ncbi:MAG: T9SS type A sorting domain-containing protein [Ignavibacteria bacterium]|jgi:hypothetical protein